MLGPYAPALACLAAAPLAASPWNQTFDYVIVGGGPAGLVLANKLSADPSIRVAVIEAGDAQYANPNVTRVDNPWLGLGSSIDWGYTSVPQKYIDNHTFPYNAGKALGGSTTINGMTYLRAEKEQIDAWAELGNAGWDWDALFPYYLSQEHFQRPDADKAENGAVFEEADHGFEGELAVGWDEYFMEDGAFAVLKETMENAGVSWNEDPNGGRMRGFSTWPLTLNSTTNTREDAARAYYYPVAQARPNLHVFLNTTATRILWSETESHDGTAVARGVEVLTASNATQAVLASSEVILSAGALRSSALLELSGVGNPAVLSPLGIETKIPLPSVGANLQDQPNTLITYASPTNWTGYPSFVTYLTASDLFGADLSALTAELRANTTQYAERIASDAPANETTVALATRLIAQQTNLVFRANSTVPLAELLWFPHGNALVCVFWNLLPFSRGSVHIASTDPTLPPAINPNFLQLPIDTLMQAAAAVKVREYVATAPLAAHVGAEISPGFASVPRDAGYRDGRWEEWLKATYAVNHHPLSTAAMRSREWGGVVDGEGRVYGAGNVRVVDASILPTQISGHLSASVYAVAGKIADAVLRRREEVR